VHAGKWLGDFVDHRHSALLSQLLRRVGLTETAFYGKRGVFTDCLLANKRPPTAEVVTVEGKGEGAAAAAAAAAATAARWFEVTLFDGVQDDRKFEPVVAALRSRFAGVTAAAAQAAGDVKVDALAPDDAYDRCETEREREHAAVRRSMFFASLAALGFARARATEAAVKRALGDSAERAALEKVLKDERSPAVLVGGQFQLAEWVLQPKVSPKPGFVVITHTLEDYRRDHAVLYEILMEEGIVPQLGAEARITGTDALLDALGPFD
jgi:hypothetical protein